MKEDGRYELLATAKIDGEIFSKEKTPLQRRVLAENQFRPDFEEIQQTREGI